MEDILEFQVEGIAIKVLTVEEARNHFVKDPKNPLKMLTTQELDRLKSADIDKEAFIFNGDLRQETQETDGTRYWSSTIIHKNWLGDMKNTGPYTASSEDDSMYYLEGKFTYDINATPVIWYDFALQICKLPLNIVSTDCVDDIHCWIHK